MAETPPENPQNTSPPAPSNLPKPEFEREVGKMWEDIHKLQADKKITSDQRSALHKVLTADQLENLPRIPADYQIRNITQQIVDNRRGLFPFTDKEDPKGFARLFRPSGEKRRVYTPLEYTAPGATTPTKEFLKNLVRDPDSKEAQVVIWLFNQFDAKGKETASKAFDSVTAREKDDVEKLMKIQELKKKIDSDKENFDIGKEGAAPPVSTSTPPFAKTGTGKIGDLEVEKARNQDFADKQRANPKGNPLGYDQRAQQFSEAIESLKEKKKNLKADLQALNNLFQELSTKPTATLDTKKLAKDYSPQKVDKDLGLKGVPLSLGRETKSLKEWISDKYLKGTHDTIIKRYQEFGDRKPSAEVVLDSLLREKYATELPGRTPEEQDAFFNEMKKILLSEEGVATNSSASQSVGAAPVQTTSMSETSATPVSGGAAASSASAVTKKEGFIKRNALRPFRLAGKVLKGGAFLAATPFRLTGRGIKHTATGLNKGYHFMTDRPAPRLTNPESSIGKFVDFWTKRDGDSSVEKKS